ncbi:MAG: hypothetical protein KJ607_02765, partial [Bacteroidetes bacterium]|nr:hypothetical protein [Bacteroidota bacterium]
AILREKSKSAAVLKDVPADCLFLETDETDCSIEEVYGKATEIRTTTIENLIKQIISNFNTYFSGVPDRI